MAAALTLSIATRARAEPSTHDGFQFRGAPGVGYFGDFGQAVEQGVEGYSVQGAAGSFELFVGDTPRGGPTIGAFAGIIFAPASTYHNYVLYTLGPYVDWYPDRRKGFHALASIAPALLTGARGFTGSGGSFGLAIGAGVGYDWWISEEWSLGALARFQYAHATMDGERSNYTEDIVATTVAFAFVYQ